MFKWTDDKDKIKDVFDNIRNFIICGTVSTGGVFFLKFPATTPFNKWQNYFVGTVLIISSLLLLVVNCKHAIIVVFKDIAREMSWMKRLFGVLYFTIYFLMAIQLYISVSFKGIPQQQPKVTKTSEAYIEQQVK